MRTTLSRLASLAGLLAATSAALGQTYRQAYPIPTGYSTYGWAVNMNINARPPEDAMMQRVVDAGFRFVRCDFSWQRVEYVKGSYDFSAYDAVTAQFKRYGVRPIFTLGYTNSNYGSNAPSTWEERAAFARFAKASAYRYRGTGIVWEIWNEPNKAMFWKPTPNADHYAALVLETGKAIRSAAPEEWIIGCSVAGFDWTFIERAFERGVLNVLDGVAIHPYRNGRGPETAELEWAKLRILVNRFRGTRHVEVISGEWGYSGSWRNVTPEIQADLAMRTMLTNLAQSVGLSVWYEWQDSGTDSTDFHDNCGLHDFYMNEKPALQAMRWLTRSVQGGTFVMRIELPRQDDYALLFRTAGGPRLVVWTAGEPHYQNIPASNSSFQAGRRDGSVFYGNSSGGFLPAYLTGSPMLIVPTTSNALWNTLASWRRLPYSPSLGTASEAKSVLGSVIVNSSWPAAPSGTKLRVQDIADTASPFGGSAMDYTLTDLRRLTMTSSAITQISEELPRLQDRGEWARTIRMTVYMPDGTSASQTCRALHDNPMWITVLTPQYGQLPVRIENPTGKAFRGTLYVNTGSRIGAYGLDFREGDRSRILMLAEINWFVMSGGYKLSIENDASSRAMSPVLESKGLRTLRLADPREGEWRYELGGSTSVSASARLNVIPGPSGSMASGLPSLRLDYSFGKGSRFISVMPPTNIQGQLWFHATHTGMWVYGDRSNNTMRARYVDSSGQTFQVTIGRIDWQGWKWVEIPLTGAGADFWNGANDGVVRTPVRITVPLLLDSRGDISTSGSIYIGSRSVICLKT